MEHIERGVKMGMSPKEKKSPHQASGPRKGGLITMPFIIVNEALEKVASFGLMPNMIFYLMKDYHLGTASGSRVIFLWSALSNALAIFGAFLSDSYLGRFRVIALGSFSSLLGMTLLWLTAMVPELRPPPCNQLIQACSSATATQFAILFSSFGLMSIGAGCLRPCSIAFGVDQLDNKENPNNERLLQSYFNWYYTSIAASLLVAVTIFVYIQDQLGWKVGFGVPAALMLFSALMFIVGSPLYVKVKATKSLFTGCIQVLVVAFKNRKLSPSHNSFDQNYHSNNSKFPALTNNLRYLNKACIIRDPARDLSPDGSASNPWILCTVEQVESVKSLLRVIPIWSTGIMITLSFSQYSFAALQANIMDRHIIANFQIPASSFIVFMVLSLSIWIAFYDRFLVPILTRYTRKPRGLSIMARMGIGLLLSCLALATSAVTESIRRRTAIEEGLENKPNAVTNMSAMWLVPSFALFGLAEAFNAVGQIEFYHSELPKSMSSIAVSLHTIGMAAANLVGSFMVDIVNGVTSRGGKESWLSNNLNKGHLDCYYWLLTGLSSINFVYYLICSWTYGPSQDGKERASAKEREQQSECKNSPSKPEDDKN